MDIARLRAKCDRLQWSVDDIDWDAPGREAVTEEQAATLAGFMADLYWIESIAAVVFRAMAEQTEDPTMRAIFSSFAIDEQRHADAELALMVRWRIVNRGETPRPNTNAWTLISTLQRHAPNVHPSVFSAIIPMTELVLDGALVRHLTTVVDDPVCHLVFDKINADEARHLAMDFWVLEHYGANYSVLANTLEFMRSFGHPMSLYAMFFGYVPMLARSRGNVERIGLDLGEVQRCMQRYIDLGKRNHGIARHPAYRVMRHWAQMMVAGDNRVGDALMRLSDFVESIRPARGEPWRNIAA